MKTHHLPRQARDKRNETGQKERRFSLRREACAVDHARLALPGALLLEGKVREYCPFSPDLFVQPSEPALANYNLAVFRCRVGNHYTTLHKNSEDAARSLGSELESHVEAIAALHRYGTVLSLYPLR
jgi:hypothetical protein